jgi:hypothetical protein
VDTTSYNVVKELGRQILLGLAAADIELRTRIEKAEQRAKY